MQTAGRAAAGALLVTSAAMMLAAPAAAQSAQIMPIIDHIHLLVPDQAQGVAWYQKHFGGQPMTEAPDRLMYGDTRLIFLRGDKGQPSSGSAIDHIGFRTTSDLAAKVAEYKNTGVKFTTEPRPLTLASGVIVNFAYLEGPAGAKVELVRR